MQRRIFLTLLVAVLAAVCYMVPPVVGAVQVSTGKLEGTVSDPSGAVIPNATVVAVREQSGPMITATNEAGRYTFPNLTPGRYTVTIEAPNFKKVVLNDVIIEVGGLVARDVVLQPGEITEEIIVTAADQPVVEVGKGPSIGDVVDARRVLDLPLNGRNPLDLIQLQGGVVYNNVSGTRTTSNNIRIDGIQAQDNFIQESINVATIPTSVDDVAEFRVTTSPVDAEYGRGAGAQVDVVTRSGTNEFHGSVWEFHRNTALDANTFFNNALPRSVDGSEVAPRDILLRHQFGFRASGPIFKNRTFFFGLYEGFRQSSGATETRTVLTAQARRGNFRYFPFFPNGNAASAAPTVDFQGNPVAPEGYTLADLQQLNLFLQDPSRASPDQTGLIPLIVDSTPLPNDFTAGDGLNTAGFTFFAPIRTIADQFTIRMDHTLNDRNRIYGVYRFQDFVIRGEIAPEFGRQTFPGFGLGGQSSRAQSFSGTLVSSLTPSVVNEFRFGFQYTPIRFFPPDEGGLAAVGGTLPTIQGFPVSLELRSFDNPINTFEAQDRVTPLFQYTDSLTWIRGNHELKGGGEVRFIRADSRDTFGVRPSVNLGEAPNTQAPLPPDVNINTASLARNILYDLTGSIGSVDQLYRTPDGKVLLPFQGEAIGIRQRQLNLFFRDEWRVRSNVKLIVGVRYEYHTVPFEVNGLLVQPTVGSNTTRFEAALGISDRTGTYADLFQPTASVIDQRAIGPVGFELVGPGQSNQVYRDDYNNFAPVIGISWSPNFKLWGLRHLFGGQDKSVIRGGYSIGYDAFPLVLFSQFSRGNAGQSKFTSLVPLTGEVSRLDNPIGVTLPVPIDDNRALQPQNFERRDFAFLIDENLRSPYVQNWNLSWQREITKDTVIELRYVGTKGTKLIRTANINEINIIENGLRNDFNVLRQALLATGDPLGATLRSYPAGIQVLNRIFATPRLFLDSFGARPNLLLGNYVLIAFDLDRTDFGARLSRAGLPVNFISTNPQFASVLYMSNYSNSSYHAAQVELRRRLAKGLSFQANYTFSRALGDGFDDGTDQFGFAVNFRTNRNRSIEKGRLVFDREHVLKINAIWELPVGPGRAFLGGTRGIIGKILEGWQLNGIYYAYSGAPRSFSSARFTLFGAGGFNAIPPNPAPGFNVNEFAGKVTRESNRVTFLPGATNPFQDPYNLNRMVVDKDGNVILVTPEPGTPGTLGLRNFTDPGEVFLDASLIKRTKVTESIDVEFRAEFFNLPNNVNFSFNRLLGRGGGANLNIQDPDFGRLSDQSNDPRIIQFALKVNF
jgi:hypothetical protein